MACFFPDAASRFLSTLFWWLLTLTSLGLFVNAVPINEFQAPNVTLFPRVQRNVPDYQGCQDAILEGQPPVDKAFYFTNLPQDRLAWRRAKGWAEMWGFSHISKTNPPVWNPPDFISRKYWGTQRDSREFQDNFSKVFAEQTSGKVWLMMPGNTMPSKESIFYRIEFPAMRDSGRVDEIMLLDMYNWPRSPFLVTERWWRKGDPDPPYSELLQGGF